MSSNSSTLVGIYEWRKV